MFRAIVCGAQFIHRTCARRRMLSSKWDRGVPIPVKRTHTHTHTYMRGNIFPIDCWAEMNRRIRNTFCIFFLCISISVVIRGSFYFMFLSLSLLTLYLPWVCAPVCVWCILITINRPQWFMIKCNEEKMQLKAAFLNWIQANFSWLRCFFVCVTCISLFLFRIFFFVVVFVTLTCGCANAGDRRQFKCRKILQFHNGTFCDSHSFASTIRNYNVWYLFVASRNTYICPHEKLVAFFLSFLLLLLLLHSSIFGFVFVFCVVYAVASLNLKLIYVNSNRFSIASISSVMPNK